MRERGPNSHTVHATGSPNHKGKRSVVVQFDEADFVKIKRRSLDEGRTIAGLIRHVVKRDLEATR